MTTGRFKARCNWVVISSLKYWALKNLINSTQQTADRPKISMSVNITVRRVSVQHAPKKRTSQFFFFFCSCAIRSL